MIPDTDILAHPEERESHLSPGCWEKYKADVRLVRCASDKGSWEDMQKDHGLNPAPVWSLRGRGFGGLHGATAGYMRLLAGLDLVYLAGDAIAVTGAAQKRANAEGDEE